MESSSHTPVRPCRPAAPYVGGKRSLAKRLVDLIEATPHTTYAEVFVGMGGVFLRRRSKPRSEIINDLSLDIWTFYRVLQEHYVPFLEMMRLKLSSRVEFERLMAVDPATLTDMQRAARFLYLQRTAYSGKVTGRAFGVELNGRPARFDILKLGPLLEDLHERISSVVVERLPWADFIRRYDHPATLFYLDPPYWDCEDDYGKGMFSKADFEAMSALLETLQGRFILSINDTPEVRRIFGRFAFQEEQLTYSLSGKPTPAKELVVTGGGGLDRPS